MKNQMKTLGLFVFILVGVLFAISGRISGQNAPDSSLIIIPKVHTENVRRLAQHSTIEILRFSVEAAPPNWSRFSVGLEAGKNIWGYAKDDLHHVGQQYPLRTYTVGLFGRFYPGWLRITQPRRLNGLYAQAQISHEGQSIQLNEPIAVPSGIYAEYKVRSVQGDLGMGYQLRLGRSFVVDPSISLGYGRWWSNFVGWEGRFHGVVALRLGWGIGIKK